MHRHTLVLALVIASLALACGRRRGGPGGGDDDDVIGGDGDGDTDCDGVICGDPGNDFESYAGSATGTWNDASVDGDVALEVYEGGYAEVDLAVRGFDGLVFTSSSPFVEVDTFGNLLGDLEGEGVGEYVYVSFEGTLSDGVAAGSWTAEGASGSGSGAWSASLQ